MRRASSAILMDIWQLQEESIKVTKGIVDTGIELFFEVKSFVKNLISGCYNCIFSCFTPRKDAIIMRLPDIFCIKTKKTEFKNGTVTNIKVNRRDLSSIIFATNNINFQMRQRFVYIHFKSCDQ